MDSLDLRLDQALLVAQNLDYPLPITVWSQVDACSNCSYLYQTTVDPGSTGNIIIDTRYKVTLQVRDGSSSILSDLSTINSNSNINETLCDLPYRWFTDQGVYQLNFTSPKEQIKSQCSISVLKSGRNDLIPIYCAISFYTLIILGSYIYRRHFSSRRVDITDQTKPQRLRSLDAFRGLTMIMMIFVNYGSAGYAFLDHAPWFGLTIADVIFPWFIFIMGVSLSLSIESQVKRGNQSITSIWLKIANRSAKLFVIGLCLNSKNSYLTSLRIPGVLQRFGVSYFVVATSRLFSIVLYSKVTMSTDDEPPVTLTTLKSIAIFLPELSVYTICLIIYFWATLFWEYDPYCPKGYQGPGGLHNLGTTFNCTGGAANRIDKIVLTENHLYRTATSKEIYHNDLRHDPEGLLGFANSIVLTAIGSFSGRVILSTKCSRQRILIWLSSSLILGSISVVLSQTELIPIIKNLWSFSFITCTGSMALIVLTLFYWLIDVWGIWENGKPFIYPGMNPILLYIGSYVLQGYFPFYFGVDETTHSQQLVRVLIAVNIWFIISYYLVKRKFFISL
ncbi:heparan-alpha-glucosaminide N-acetyltransferase-like [Panonychus citri]|uniref:heparan-alpha-glucosaminide N-acetyltransferase-like n=1 Tax=Panonychus citri TaxID=50023 RepID=UPI002307B8F2|nr:heparan-alpha-glucosaminide N-acetyltransferase-like [Panonychus citri]XP_053204599.1 heparan-alpha-glucosaminide N-acetyltransferase-like [Panonychus citri]